MKMKTDEEIQQLAHTVGAIQDTIRLHANRLEHIHQHLYAMIISLDLVYMDLVSDLPEETRREIIQNEFDESLSGAENDLVFMTTIRDYFNKRMDNCKDEIKRRKEESK